MATLLKLPVLLGGAVFYDRSCTPPTPPPTPDQQRRAKKQIGWYEVFVARPILSHWLRMVYWAFTVTEAASIFVGYSTHTVKTNAGPHPTSRLSGTFLLGTGLIVAGSALRFRCFCELGRQFTFALTLRTDHMLVTTGPYAVVRHPAYTGGIMMLLGAVLTLLCDGSWWWCGGCATAWGTFLELNFVISAALCAYAFARGAKEDTYLEKFFGERWARYARDVPYRYIPGVC
ncbi:hypothetical protein DFH09DRAFT_1190033 [Mycena vulgaris]|nr:hypothetical protein DFH09DRAFT_1190033 [Mycena vulgaris]